MTVPGWRLAYRVTATWAVLVLFLLPALHGLSVAEGGGTSSVGWLVLLRLIAPGCAAAAVAVVVAGSRLDGSWDGWTSLGIGKWSRLVPLLAFVLPGAVLLSGLVLAPTSPGPGVGLLALPSPVPDRAVLWWGSSGWERPDLSAWQESPSSMPTAGLVARLGASPPRGARRGVDRAELLLRGSLALLWLLALPLGAGVALRRTGARSRLVGAPAIAAALESVAWLVGLQVLALAAVAYASSMM